MNERRIDISVVVPCLNEEANVRPLAERFLAAAAEARLTGELVYVDDGSTDGTWEAIEALRHELGEDVVVGVRHDQNPASPPHGAPVSRRHAVPTPASSMPTSNTHRRKS